MGFALPTSRRTLLAIAALCIAGVAAALAGQYGFDMRPCPWCILQRVIFIVIALLCLAGAAARTRVAHRAAAGSAIVLCVLGAVAALYQHFVAARSSSCNLTLADKVITALRLDTALPSLFEVTGSCADAAVSVMGVPFEFWSLALFVLLAAMGAHLALRRN
jgi:disulfide bond formation protein DsbB